MKLIYSGKTKEFTSELEEKLNGKLTKLGKMIEQRGEREAHLMHRVERHIHKVELTVNFYDHALVGIGTDPDLGQAVAQSIEKLEKQVVKLRGRWRDVHRDPKTTRARKEQLNGAAAEGETAPPRNGAASRAVPRVYLVNHQPSEKPQTLEEALLTIDDKPYVIYRDSDKSCVSVLVRRSDGDFDLIET